MPGLERSLRTFSWYLPVSRIYFWTPVFFLYFIARFPLEQVLQLQAIYYLVVVALEVPSGYLSDRVGRRLTLLISALAMVMAYALFLFGGESFAAFAAAQASLAVGFSFVSGTDTSLHYDTLTALGREAEFPEQQARLNRAGYLAASAGAIVAGALGVLDLRLAYALSLVQSLVLAALVLAMREPPRIRSGWAQSGFAEQLRGCLRYLRRPILAWLFAYVVLQTTISHIPYEFAQPYVATVLGELPSHTRLTPLATGFVSAGIAFVASFAAARSIWLRDRLGTGGALLGVTGVQTGLIAIMGLILHPLVVPLILLRSCQSAIGDVIVNTTVTPRVEQSRRATYLSLHSLAGRLGYAGVLLALSALAGGRSIDEPETMTALLRWSAALAAVGLLALGLSRSALRDASPLDSAGTE